MKRAELGASESEVDQCWRDDTAEAMTEEERKMVARFWDNVNDHRRTMREQMRRKRIAGKTINITVVDDPGRPTTQAQREAAAEWYRNTMRSRTAVQKHEPFDLKPFSLFFKLCAMAALCMALAEQHTPWWGWYLLGISLSCGASAFLLMCWKAARRG